MDATAPFKQMEQDVARPAKPAFREALAFWVKLGFISFGGPAGQIGIMHDLRVEKKRWSSDSRFLHALNLFLDPFKPTVGDRGRGLMWLSGIHRTAFAMQPCRRLVFIRGPRPDDRRRRVGS